MWKNLPILYKQTPREEGVSQMTIIIIMQLITRHNVNSSTKWNHKTEEESQARRRIANDMGPIQNEWTGAYD